jgi:PhoPQ-activated pathogenicity-related protein
VPPLFAATGQPFSRRRFFPDSFPPHQYHRLTVTAGIREENEKNTIKNPADKNQKSKAKISRRTGL